MGRCGPETPHGEMFIVDTDDDFDLNIIKTDGDVLWLLYLLDRLGGELRYRDLKCTIRRSGDDCPLFIIQSLAEGMRDAANFAFGRQYEHVAFSSEWQILSKEVTELKIVFLIIEQKIDPQAKFLSILDTRRLEWSSDGWRAEFR